MPTNRLELELTVDDFDLDGRGVGSVPATAGQPALEVHVAGALPTERVRARIDHRSPHQPRAWATLVAILGEPASDRVTPSCPAYGRCGGCPWQHLAYPAQLTAKRRRVERALAHEAALAALPVADVVASPCELGYRNKAKYVISVGRDGTLVRGSYQPDSHRVVAMAGCRVPEPPIDEVAGAALAHLSAARVPVYDERAHTGELRYLVVRANHEGRLLVVIVTRSAGPRAALAGAARALRRERPEVAGVVHDVNPSTGGTILGNEGETLDGEGTLSDCVGDVELALSARAFFQVNRDQAAVLYSAVARAVRARAGLRALDLYCGVGGIALTLARAGARVVGVEAHAPAIEDAARSASLAGLDAQATFLVGDAASGLVAARRRLGDIDAVIVNPPRKGLSAEVRKMLAAPGPHRLVYVSCGPESLALDLAELAAAGWRIESVQPFDLLPGTPHVETVVSLVR